MKIYKTALDKEIILDDDFYEKVKDRIISVGKLGYPILKGKLLHYHLMKSKKGYVIDHSNKNKLDNRLLNLRYCTRQQNVQNIKKNKIHLLVIIKVFILIKNVKNGQ